MDKGEIIKKVASNLGVGEITVGDWKRKGNQIGKWVMLSANNGCSYLYYLYCIIK